MKRSPLRRKPARRSGALLPIVVITLLTFFTSSSTHAQWSMRSYVGSANFVRFMDDIGSPEIGYVGVPGRGILRSTDTGYTWSNVQVDGHGGEVFRDLVFKPDGLTGWTISQQGAYVTTDGGLHWNRCFSGTVASVTYMNAVNAVVLGCRSANSVISYNDGQTWSDYASGGLNGFANLDDQRFYLSSFSSPAVYTTNAGMDWHTSVQSVEVWQPVALKVAGGYLAVSEKTNQVLRSADNGFSWQQVGMIKVTPTGCVRGTEANLIAQTYTGMVRSTDLGETWEDLCGPDNGYDTRFWVRGTEIFAVSRTGMLMYNPTSQSGGAEAYSIGPTPLKLVTDGCATVTGEVRVTTATCGAILVKASLIGPPEFSLGLLKLPLQFGPSVDIPIRYQHINAGNDTAMLLIKLDLDGVIIDSAIPVYGEKLKILLGTLSPASIEMVIDEHCVGTEALVTVTNPTCDPFTIDSARLTDNKNFGISGITFPQVVGPKGSFTFIALAKNATDPKHEAELDVFISNLAGKMMLTDTLDLERIGNFEQGTLAEHRYEFLTSCEPKKDSLTFRNTFCDTIIVDSVVFANPSYFQRGNLSLPYALPRHGVLQIPYLAIPPKPGPQTSKVRLVYRSGVNPTQQITYLLSSSKVELHLPDDTVQFTAAPDCPTFDSTIEIRNVLCDPIKILTIKPAIQPDYTITIPPLPVTLNADEVLSLGVSAKLLAKGMTRTYVAVRFEVYGETRDTTFYVRVDRTKAFGLDPHLSKVAFDRTSICAPRRKTIMIENTYCVDLSIDRLLWSTTSSPQFKTISQPATPKVLKPGQRDSIVIEFAPAQIGLKNAAMELRLSSSYGTIDTFFAVDGIGAGSINATIVDAKLAFGSGSTCQKLRSETTVVNDGCEALDLTTATVANGDFTLVSPSLPHHLEPGDLVKLVFETARSVAGQYVDNVRVRLLSKQNIEQLLDCELSATLESEAASLQFAPFDAGTHSECAPIDTFVVILNPRSCVELTVQGEFTTTDAQVIGTNSVTIPAGGSANFRFTIFPNNNTSLSLHLYGSNLDTLLPISYSFVAGGGNLALSKTSIDITTTACTVAKTQLEILNSTCKAISISSIAVKPIGSAATRFSVANTFTFPIEVQPSDLLTVDLSFDPNATGTNVSTLEVSEASGTSLSASLTGTISPVQSISAGLSSAGMQEVVVGSELEVDVSMSSAIVSPIVIDNLTAAFEYDNDMLKLTRVEPVAGWTLVSNQPAPEGSVLVLSHPSSVFAVDDPIAKLHFTSTLSKDRSGSVSLKDLKINPADPRFAECIATTNFAPTANEVKLTYLCGGETLRQALANELPLKNIRVRPHPVTHADKAISVTFDAATEMTLEVELLDVLGRPCVTMQHQATSGPNELRLDVSSAGSGWKLLRLRGANGTSGTRILITE